MGIKKNMNNCISVTDLQIQKGCHVPELLQCFEYHLALGDIARTGDHRKMYLSATNIRAERRCHGLGSRAQIPISFLEYCDSFSPLCRIWLRICLIFLHRYHKHHCWNKVIVTWPSRSRERKRSFGISQSADLTLAKPLRHNNTRGSPRASFWRILILDFVITIAIHISNQSLK